MRLFPGTRSAAIQGSRIISGALKRNREVSVSVGRTGCRQRMEAGGNRSQDGEQVRGMKGGRSGGDDGSA